MTVAPRPLDGVRARELRNMPLVGLVRSTDRPVQWCNDLIVTCCISGRVLFKEMSCRRCRCLTEDFSSQFHKHQKKLHAKPREGLLTPRQRVTSRLTGLFPLVVTNQESHAKVKSCQQETCARLSRKRGASLVPQTTGRTTSRRAESGQAGEKGVTGTDVFNFGVGTALVKNEGNYSFAATLWRLPMSCRLRGPRHRQEGSSVSRDLDSCPCPD